MAHEIETMAYTNEVPWHGLGTHIEKAPTVDKMLTIAGLDWEVEKRKTQSFKTDNKGKLIKGTELILPHQYALHRSTDDKFLSTCGSQYTPVQNKEAFQFFKDFVETGKAKMETAGSLKNGQFVWGLANLQTSFKLKGDDEVKGYLLVAAPHVAGKAFIIKFTTVRVVCNNTLTMALKGDAASEFRMPHRCKFDEFMIEKAKETLGIAREQLTEFEKTAKQLQKLNLSWDECVEILAPIYQPSHTAKFINSDFEQAASLTLKRLKDVMYRAPGAQPNNGWGLLNAVTYYHDHVASRTADKRLENAWFGHAANKKEVVLRKLMMIA